MKKFFGLILALILALSLTTMAWGEGNVAKVGDTEYATIDGAIAAWTNGTTLTLLSDVTLSDAITIKSTEHHILNLGTYTMTAASGKHAIEITCNGQGSATYGLTVNADEENPGGIIATGKSCIYYRKSDTTQDRVIIQINGGVFNGSYAVNVYSSNRGTNCPQVNIAKGTFNGNVNIGHGKLMASGGVFNGWVNCTGDSTAYRQITGGTFKSWQYMTADASNKFWVGTSKENYNVGVYVDDNGYLVVGGPEITGPGDKFTASSANYGGWSSYLKYSSAATNGLYYTCVAEALADNKSGKVTVYTNQLDLTSSSFKGTINLPNNESTLTVTLAEGSIPAWNVGTECEGKIAVYADAISSGVVTRTYTLKDGYKVTLKDGSDVLDNVTYYLCDVATTLPTLTKTGYTFAGWYADEAFTGDAVTEIAVGSTGDKSYYAKWTPNTYTVTLNANEGTVAEGKDVTSYTYGEGAALPAAADMTKTGYTFAGWYDNEQISDDSVTEIPADATGNKSYYAKWTPNTYTVTLNTDGGTIAEGKDVTDYTYGEGAALPAAADMTKSGYTFAGWYEDAQFSGDAVAEISTTDTGNKTYYAKWDKIPPAPVYPSVDTPAFDPDEDVDVEDNTLNDAALAVGGAIENGDIKMEPAAGYTAEEITRLQNEGKLNLVIQKKLGYDTTEKSLIDAAIAKVGGSASQVDVVYIDVTPVLMTDDGIVVATITDTEKPLTITLDLSAEMQKAAKEGKFISVIRVHDGNVTFLDSKLNAEKTKITFTSSEFSTYAVVALDKDPSANTFDAGIAMYGAMAVLAATGSAAIIIGKKRNS